MDQTTVFRSVKEVKDAGMDDCLDVSNMSNKPFYKRQKNFQGAHLFQKIAFNPAGA